MSPLARRSVVDLLTDALRQQILDGRLPPGSRLPEVSLAGSFEVSRHTLRAALRQLAGEGLIDLRPQRGARVATLDRGSLLALFELRTALELEAAHLALVRGDGRLPAEVHAALDRLVSVCARAHPSWRTVADCHAALHGAIVAASKSPRIVAAYNALEAEMRLFLMELQAVWPLGRMGPHHEALVAGLESAGTDILRLHIAEGKDAVLARAAKSPAESSGQ